MKGIRRRSKKRKEGRKDWSKERREKLLKEKNGGKREGRRY